MREIFQHSQTALFEAPASVESLISAPTSGTFIDNMRLPVHRWFKYSAGFAAQWVGQTLDNWDIAPGAVILDPFAGSGTVPLVCDSKGIASLGVEAHPFVARICRAKLLCWTSIDRFNEFARQTIKKANQLEVDITDHAPLVRRSYDDVSLASLSKLKLAWSDLDDSSPESELVWLVITAILRPSSKAGTAQWQYILPNKTKKNAIAPLSAFHQQIEMMKTDMRYMQANVKESKAEIIAGDSRLLSEIDDNSIDAVITSPPYANNYDYADALRFEMTFWGDVRSWGDIHDKIRKHLIVSSSQHSSKERLVLDDLLKTEEIRPIRDELRLVAEELAIVRESHGGKKQYHTMIAAYCRDIALSLVQLRRVCKPGGRMCWVIGDSAPYGIYCPIDEWIGRLALEAGFNSYSFEKLRDRNIKWKNRKHRVPLKEGLLWIEG